ncbi:hypothetical protein HDF11_003835 [Tunturiibacter psychrotolerans]
MPCFSSLLAAAAFWSARFTAADFFPGFGLQLPFSPGAFPATGSNPGQHRELRFASEDFLEEDKVVFEEVFRSDFFAVVIVLWTQWFDAQYSERDDSFQPRHNSAHTFSWRTKHA